MPSTDTRGPGRMDWQPHVVRAGEHRLSQNEDPDPNVHRDRIEPWLSALFQAEHLNLLVGSGFTTAISVAADALSVDMTIVDIDSPHADAVLLAADETARRLGRATREVYDYRHWERISTHGSMATIVRIPSSRPRWKGAACPEEPPERDRTTKPSVSGCSAIPHRIDRRFRGARADRSSAAPVTRVRSHTLIASTHIRGGIRVRLSLR